jgi:hypothetical protein
MQGEDRETHMEGSSTSKEILLTPQPVHSRSFSSKSMLDTLAPAPSEDEEMAGSADNNHESPSLTPKGETVPKLRKHPAKFECSLPNCKKRFTRRVNLHAHIRAHSNNERSFLCNECERRYARIEDLNRHVKEAHTCTLKQHVCGILGKPGPKGCGQSFTRAEALRRHLRSKTGSKCGKSVNEEGPETPHHSSDDVSVHGEEQHDSDVIITDESSWLHSRAVRSNGGSTTRPEASDLNQHFDPLDPTPSYFSPFSTSSIRLESLVHKNWGTNVK